MLITHYLMTPAAAVALNQAASACLQRSAVNGVSLEEAAEATEVIAWSTMDGTLHMQMHAPNNVSVAHTVPPGEWALPTLQ